MNNTQAPGMPPKASPARVPPALVPPALAAHLGQADWKDTSGESGARVFRLTQADQPTRYLKISPRTLERDLRLEHDKLTWLRGRLPVPEVVAYAEDAAHQYLLTTAVPGIDAAADEMLARPHEVVPVLARSLRRFHEAADADLEACPFDRRPATLVREAQYRLENDLVNVEDFDEARVGRTPQSVLAELQRELAVLFAHPADHGHDRDRDRHHDQCLIHGDYCFPNIILEADRAALAGFIDLGGAGVGDRYFDLALAERSIRRNVGPAWVLPFFEAYGLPSSVINWRKIAFFQAVDEFF